MKYLSVLVLLFLTACGTDGHNGQDGAQGPKGNAGTLGPTGQPGQDSNPVTVVQFCPGITHYPDTFCEVGFCVDGSLYATYSTHGGFSVAIPSGTYNSNGINCSCTFHVTNCAVD